MTTPPRPLPPGRLVAYYGDDFTGSAAVMEVFYAAGLDAVLFLKPPTPEQLAEFATCRAVGIAGTARAESPAWMARELPAIFRSLRALNAPIVQYKICSTLDSSPTIGSIGKAAEIGMAEIGGRWHPILAAAPAIGRYQAFGHFFALSENRTYRLDRHPVMSRHPATPISEADVRLHLGRQTQQAIGLVDLVAMKSGKANQYLEQENRAAKLIALDVVDDETLEEAGRLIWEAGGDRVFAVASQGLEYALVAYWRRAGLLPDPPHATTTHPVDQIVAVSGSCSAVTAGQIGWALTHGFGGVPVDPAMAVDETLFDKEVGRACDAALAVFATGKSPILFTANGPEDPITARLEAEVTRHGVDGAEVNARLARGLGRALQRVLAATGIRRAAIAGGDTSSRATLTLDVYAVTVLATICPGGSLLKTHTENPAFEGIELALKGGQMGPPDYFSRVRAGGG